MENLIKLGVCGKAHGIKGGFQFNLENPENSILDEGTKILLIPSDSRSQLPQEGQMFTIQKISFGHKTMAFLEGIDNRNVVEEMIPFEIFVDRNLFPEIDEDEIYLSDLVGLKVYCHSSGKEVGTIKKFYDNTAQAIIVIRGIQNLELPLIEQFFPVIDLENKRIEVNIPEVIE